MCVVTCRLFGINICIYCKKMPTTRKKVVKTVYKDENDSEPEETGDFSDSGSDAIITDLSSSEDDEQAVSSGNEFEEENSTTSKTKKQVSRKKPQFAKNFIKKIRDESQDDLDDNVPSAKAFSVKDLTDADKLLPSFLDLSESDSSDDESPSQRKLSVPANTTISSANTVDSDDDAKMDYQDVWSNNVPDDSEEIAQKTFKELEIHKTKIEETKASILKYTAKTSSEAFDVKDLLAQGEEIPEPVQHVKKTKKKKKQNDSDSEMEDWEEVKESKALPASGLQVVVDFPDAVQRRSKKVDVEMMMKRKMNRVKKEYQVYMHKVHVLCWLGHGNYVSSVLNDQEILSAVLSLVPSKECYPGERVDVKYVEQITKWFKNKLTLKQDKHENKFKPKAPPLKDILLKEIKNKVVSTKKYMFFIFVSMLRALGLQCRVMFNFVALPIRPPSSELCSLSTKVKEELKNSEPTKEDAKKTTEKKRATAKKKLKQSIPQVDGNYDSDIMDVDGNYYSDTDIMQVDGNDDGNATLKGRKTRLSRVAKVIENKDVDNEDVSPPKKAKTSTSDVPNREPALPKRGNRRTSEEKTKTQTTKPVNLDPSAKVSPTPKSPSLTRRGKTTKAETEAKEENNSEKAPALPKRGNRRTSEEKTKTPTTKPVKIDPSAKVSPTPKSLSLTRRGKATIAKTEEKEENISEKAPALPKRGNRRTSEEKTKTQTTKPVKIDPSAKVSPTPKSLSLTRRGKATIAKTEEKEENISEKAPSQTKLRSTRIQAKNDVSKISQEISNNKAPIQSNPPKIIVTSENGKAVSSAFFESNSKPQSTKSSTRRRSNSADTKNLQNKESMDKNDSKTRSKSASTLNKSKYFNDGHKSPTNVTKRTRKSVKDPDGELRVSHRDIMTKTKTSPKSNVTSTLIKIMKNRMEESGDTPNVVKKKTKSVPGNSKNLTKGDSDYEPEAISDDDFKPSKISPKPSMSRKLDRRVLSTDDEAPKDKTDVWCEVFVEELEQWIAVDVVRGQVHCTNEIYSRSTHPVCYIVGWDNTNYLKDLTRRYVPQWNTVTRKQRVEPAWWAAAIAPWQGPKTARDREEDEALDRMQLDAPLPKSIAEYKNHPLYALKRHLLKYEALYPPDAATLGFVRNEAVYARDCVYVCRSRDTWLKDAKVVRLGEKPYKIVKARPKWDKLSNKCITDKPLEIFGPWQVQEYEPPVARDGQVPRNAYGNVELFKQCMLPKGTVHVKLPGLNKVAKKLSIDCAPAMTGFDFNGGWSHPVYDGFVVCAEFEEIVTQAWLEDQEEMVRREREKTEARVYGNWKKLIKGLMIRERLKLKYGFEEPSTSDKAKKGKGPRFVTKRKSQS